MRRQLWVTHVSRFCDGGIGWGSEQTASRTMRGVLSFQNGAYCHYAQKSLFAGTTSGRGSLPITRLPLSPGRYGIRSGLWESRKRLTRPPCSNCPGFVGASTPGSVPGRFIFVPLEPPAISPGRPGSLSRLEYLCESSLAECACSARCSLPFRVRGGVFSPAPLSGWCALSGSPGGQLRTLYRIPYPFILHRREAIPAVPGYYKGILYPSATLVSH